MYLLALKSFLKHAYAASLLSVARDPSLNSLLHFMWVLRDCWRRETGLSPLVKYFTDRSKAGLLLWIFYVFVLSCVFYVFVLVCLYVICGHLLGKG